MFYRFDCPVPLRWVDVDSAGVVNNSVYLSLMEQARYAYFSELGLMVDHRVPFVLAETTVKFVRPGRLGMAIQVAVRTSRLGTTSFHMDFEVRNDEQVLATANAALVFVDERLQPCPIPADFRTTVEHFEDLAGK